MHQISTNCIHHQFNPTQPIKLGFWPDTRRKSKSGGGRNAVRTRVVGCFWRWKRESIRPTSGGGFREALASEHGVQHGAVVRGFAGRDDEEDIRVIGETAEEDIELGGFGVHDDEAGGGRGGEGVAGGAVLKRLHDIG